MSQFSPDDFLPYLLNRAAEAASLQFAQVYKDRYGLLRTDWRVLFHLGHYGAMTAADIGTRSGIHKTKISRAVMRLDERRFLSRAQDDRDRRREHLTLTQAGRGAYKDLSAYAAAYDRMLTAHLSDEAAQVLRDQLRNLATT